MFIGGKINKIKINNSKKWSTELKKTQWAR